MFMCRSADDSVGALIDARNDSGGNYVSISQTGKRDQEFRAPITSAGQNETPEAYALQVSAESQTNGPKLRLQIQSVNHGPLQAWFDWTGHFTGTCRRVPAPPDISERG